MKLYYFSNQIYQLSYAIPFYNKLGGTFIVNSISKYWRFKKHLQGLASYNEKTFLKTPAIIIRKNGLMQDIEGVILSFSNDWIYRNPMKCRTIFHEHGASDKRIGSNANSKPLEKLINFDYIFLMSPKNQIKIEDLSNKVNKEDLDTLKEKFIKIYNLRFAGYENSKTDKAKICKEIGIKNTNNKTVLYAPTWRFGNGTLRKYFHRFAKEITKEYNLIIRPHFHEAKLIPRFKLWAQIHNIKNIYFSNPSNLRKNDTFRDFIASDILLSDTSAVLYEYLITENPIIIINPNYSKHIKMPDNLNIMKNAVLFNEQDNINKLIATTLLEKQFSKNYHKMYSDCFYTPYKSNVINPIIFVKNLLKTLRS